MEFKYPLIRPFMDDEEAEAVKKVIDSGFITEGPVTREFEKKIAEYCGTKYAVSATSCTTGLEIALRALDLGPDDEVIIPDFTYPATLLAVTIVGAKPVIVDVRRSDYLIDYDEIEKAITPNTKAILPVSEFGAPLDYDRLNAIKKRHGVYIIEDAACALGSEFNGTRVGSFSDITCFSLHPRKTISTGEGGINVTDDPVLHEKMARYKHFGWKEGEFVDWIASNYKLSDIQSAIGLVQLGKIEKIIARRIELAKNYMELLDPDIFTIPKYHDDRSTYQSFCVIVKGDRDEIIRKGKESGVETQIGTYALSLQPGFRDAKKIGTLENSQYLFKQGLTLPMYHEMSLDDQKEVVRIITELAK